MVQKCLKDPVLRFPAENVSNGTDFININELTNRMLGL